MSAQTTVAASEDAGRYTTGCPARTANGARDVIVERAHRATLSRPSLATLPQLRVSRPQSWLGYHRRLMHAMTEHGIVDPFNALNAAVYTGVNSSIVCTSLLMESWGGKNVWGHDPGGSALPWALQGMTVTESDFRAYWFRVGQGAGNQGCGGMQLTSTGLQALAQTLGGCWRSGPNFKVGAIFMKQLLTGVEGDVQLAFQRFNGSGQAAQEYGIRAAALERQLHVAFMAVR